MIIDFGYWTRVLKKLLIAAVIIIGLIVTFKLSIFYLPFLIAFIVSLILEPIVRFIKNRTSFARKTCAIIVMIIFAILIIGLLVWGIISLISEASNLLSGLNGYYDNFNNLIQKILYDTGFSKIQLPAEVKTIIDNSSAEILEYGSNYVENILRGFLNSVTSLPIVGIYAGVTLLGIYFMCADRIYILDEVEHHLPKLWVKKIGKHIRELIEVLGSFLKAEVILIVISFIEVLVGLYIFKVIGFNIQYPLLMALLIGFVDALPILGSGTIMLPWALINAINGDLKLGIAITVLWIIISIVRQLLEPKIVSKQIGIHPIFTLIAMYTGLKFMGILGLILGPIFLIIFKNVFGTFIDKGVFKTIFDRK